ncbi:putative schlank, partial [Operophtera brumata]
MLRFVLDKFWDESIWLPENTTWNDITPGSNKDIVYTDYRHLLYPPPLAVDKPSTLVKFCENMWAITFYVYSFSFGLYVMWDKEWLWNIDHCFIGYPHQ